MRNVLLFLLIGFCISNIYGQPTSSTEQCKNTIGQQRFQTICNPIDLPYRFMLEEEPSLSYREAADPVVIYFQNHYWLFASKCGGYYYSTDFKNWNLVVPKGLPLEEWAPTVEAIDNHLYFATMGSGLYKTDDPISGNWSLVSIGLNVGQDQAFCVENDGRMYLYTGCSNHAPIRGCELDTKRHFAPILPFQNLISGDPLHRGWEASRSKNPPTDSVSYEKTKIAPYIEGAWVNKVNNKYYLQYAAPGTQHDSYGDGVFVSTNPLGPFEYEPYSPFSFKPTGFARGAGHGCTFKDEKDNFWHFATVALSKHHNFERRLGVYPTHFFQDGQLACNTYLGDYPQYLPGTIQNPFESNSPGWMLLSLFKPVTVSSELPGCSAQQAVNENLHDWWSATTGNLNEWLQVDLGKKCRIEALQINFADEGSNQFSQLPAGEAYRYLVEVSDDGLHWKLLLDRRDNKRDAPHDYSQLEAPVLARYLKITNLYTPAGAKFSISGFRVFGNAMGRKPEKVKNIVGNRNPQDNRLLHLSWNDSKGAEFYIVRYGIRPDRLYLNHQVYGATCVDLNFLNTGVSYYATVDAINSSGIKCGTQVIFIPAK